MQLGNHLGNVLVTVSDKKHGIADPLNAALIKFFEPYMLSGTDYYPFGMAMRVGGESKYRFGFNGQEMSNEVKGEGNSYTAEFWEYDPRLGRRWNLDPVFKSHLSPYSTYSNNPITNIDPKGDSDSSIVNPAGNNVSIPKNTTNIKKSRLGIVDGTMVQAEHTQGAIESFKIVVKTFSARYSTLTGDFLRYGYTDENGDIEEYNFDNYSGKFNIQPLQVVVGAIESNYGLWEMSYDHSSYPTTTGKLRPIYKSNGLFRSPRAKVFKQYSNAIKGIGLGLSIINNAFGAAQVYQQYKEGGAKNINIVDATSVTVGTIGVTANGLSWAGYGGVAVSTIGKAAGYGGL